MAMKQDYVFVIGHKNPDTDSICSAIAYAYLKNAMTGTTRYLAMRAGDVNAETAYVLERFSQKAPTYLTDVTNRIRDIEIEEISGIDRTISLREAWNIMRDEDISTLCVTRHGRLEGIITMEDIAMSCMDTMNHRILAEAHTKFRKMEETIGGQVVAGNAEAYYTKGKVLIAAADGDYMASCMEHGDLILLGNRRELIEKALENHAGCLVVCTVSDIDEDLKQRAEEIGCVVICAPSDTYSVARLLGQSMPVGYFMKRNNISLFQEDELTEEVREVMEKKRYKNFPVLDRNGNYAGMIARRHLINEGVRKVILVDHNERSQAVSGLENVEIVEVIDHHKIGNVETIAPIYFRNQPLGCTATIITQMYREAGVTIPPQIAGVLLSAILSDTLMFRSPTCTAVDETIARELAEIAGVEVEELATAMFRAGSDFGGKDIEEIFFQDFKSFDTAQIHYGIGQVNVMSAQDGEELKERMLKYLGEGGPNQGHRMLFFMLTNILAETTELVYAGEGAERLIASAFDVTPIPQSATLGTVILPNVLSRKKQMLPPIMSAILADD